jgi:hypothetical protein
LDGEREVFCARAAEARSGWAERESPLRLAAGLLFLLVPTPWALVEGFERVIGMAESLYFVKIWNCHPAEEARKVIFS